MPLDNEAEWDRAVRMLAGILVLHAGWGGSVGGPAGTVATVIGILGVATGLAGWCPLYSVLRFSTKGWPG